MEKCCIGFYQIQPPDSSHISHLFCKHQYMKGLFPFLFFGKLYFATVAVDGCYIGNVGVILVWNMTEKQRTWRREKEFRMSRADISFIPLGSECCCAERKDLILRFSLTLVSLQWHLETLSIWHKSIFHFVRKKNKQIHFISSIFIMELI